MNKQDEAKQKFIQAMRDLFPDNSLVQKSAKQAEKDTLKGIVNQMIMGIARYPEYDTLIPALQEAMDALREEYPNTNDSATKTIETWRALFSNPNVLPPISMRSDETSEQFAKRVVRSAEEGIE